MEESREEGKGGRRRGGKGGRRRGCEGGRWRRGVKEGGGERRRKGRIETQCKGKYGRTMAMISVRGLANL